MPDKMMKVFHEMLAGKTSEDRDQLIAKLSDSTKALPSMSDLRTIGEEFWEYFTSVDLSVGDSQPHVQLVAWGWLAQAFRQARAAFLLCDAGFSDSAPANARAAVEHGVYLALLASVRDKELVLDKLESTFLKNTDRLRDSGTTNEDQSELIQALLEVLPDITPNDGTGWVTVFEQVCKKLETGEDVYEYWRQLCAMIHPGFVSAGPFVVSSVDVDTWEVPERLSREPMDSPDSRGILQMAIGGCAWAAWAAESLFDSISFTGSLLEAKVRRLAFIPLELKQSK
jgi:hypothetical protein